MPTFRALLRAAVPAGAGIATVAAALAVVPAAAPPVVLSPEPGSAVVGPVHVQRVGSGATASMVSLRTSTPGYVRATSGLLGETPRGLHIWVDPAARHRGNIVKNVKATVSVWRNAGLHASYEGLGTPKRREGVITVAEGSAGCKAGTARVGNTWQSWLKLPGGRAYIYGARVVICPKLYRYGRWQWSATVRHELGHAAGLGHFDGRYKGSTQVMRSANKSPVSTFKAGDLNGLRYFARNNNLVRSLIPPRGGVRDVSLLSRTVLITGWARLDWYPAKPVRIVVTESGTRVTSALTGAGHSFAASALGLGRGDHRLCITAVSTVNPAARRKLGCTTFSLG